VEIATGLLFILIFNFQLSPFDFAQGKIFNEFSIISLVSFCYLLYIVSSLIVIFVYDLYHYIIPDLVLWPAIAAALIYRVAFSFAPHLRGSAQAIYPELVEGFGAISPYLFSALGAFTFFLAIILITRGKGMGFGDAKLAILLGLLLGWPNTLIALFLAFFGGAMIGVILVLFGRKKFESQIPFGPFLIAATLIVLFWSQFFSDWLGTFYF